MPSVIGIAAILVTALSFAMRDDRTLRALNICGLCLWALYYAAMGAWPAVAALALALSIVMTARFGMRLTSGTLIRSTSPDSISAASGGMTETLPPAGSAAINFGVAMLSGGALTACLLLGQVIWLFYATRVGAAMATVNGVLCLAAIGVEPSRRVAPPDRIKDAP